MRRNKCSVDGKIDKREKKKHSKGRIKTDEGKEETGLEDEG